MPKSDHVGLGTQYRVPDVSKDDLSAFHEVHFSLDAVASFRSTFVEPPAEKPIEGAAGDEYWEEEDDLGYYDDGVKRTLTDEQIQIFRHSELEALRKEEEKRSLSKTTVPLDEAMDTSATGSDPDQASASTTLPNTFHSNKKKKKKKGNKRGRPEPKPDLRKRTWDVVDKGLDSLDYD